jgi:hypothetical protein
MKSTAADKAFLHGLYVKHYMNKPEPVQLEVCVRCGGRGKLGQRQPYRGLCRKCRRAEYSKN